MTQDDLERILADHPTLCDFGFGTFDYNHGRQLSDAEFAKQLDAARAALRFNLDQCNVCFEWIYGLARTSTVNTKRTSYGLKHHVERSAGVYVTNGAFIVSAIYAGFKWRLCTPNVHINLGEIAIRERLRKSTASATASRIVGASR